MDAISLILLATNISLGLIIPLYPKISDHLIELKSILKRELAIAYTEFINTITGGGRIVSESNKSIKRLQEIHLNIINDYIYIYKIERYMSCILAIVITNIVMVIISVVCCNYYFRYSNELIRNLLSLIFPFFILVLNAIILGRTLALQNRLKSKINDYKEPQL
jgi:hypothetical protein